MRLPWGINAPDLDNIWKQKKWDIYKNDLLRDEESIESPVDQTKLTNRYTEEAVKFITANKNQPFFLYMPHTMVHVPLFVSDDLYVDDPKQAYKLAMEHVDWSVGQVLKTLKEHGLTDNTLVVYTSDNGPWLSKNHHGGSALPLRDGKGTTFDGGMRVPCVMQWPQGIPAGGTCSSVASTIDLLPTIAKITGSTLPKHPIDGLDISAMFKDPNETSPHDAVGFYYYKNSRIEAVRQGKWKLRIPGERQSGNYELYDLRVDIGESKNIAADHANVVAAVADLAAKYDADLKANSRPIWRTGMK